MTARLHAASGVFDPRARAGGAPSRRPLGYATVCPALRHAYASPDPRPRAPPRVSPSPPAPLSPSYAAARGDARKLRLMMQQGFNPDSVDYDGRTALMLGCARGHPDVVSLLLQAGGWQWRGRMDRAIAARALARRRAAALVGHLIKSPADRRTASLATLGRACAAHTLRFPRCAQAPTPTCTTTSAAPRCWRRRSPATTASSARSRARARASAAARAT